MQNSSTDPLHDGNVLNAVTSENWDPRATEPVAIFLHGYGSNEHDLTALAQALPTGMQWASLRAPVALAPASHAWFHITTPGNPDPSILATATDAIWHWIEQSLPTAARIVPIGFSQGALMASQLLRTKPERVLAPVLLGGFVAGDDQPADASLRDSLPALFSGRGADDQVIAALAVARTDAWLPTHTTPTIKLYPGLAHGINSAELTDVQQFLADKLSPAE